MVVREKLAYQVGVISPLQVLADLVDRHGDFLVYNTSFGKFYLLNRPSLIRDAVTNATCGRDGILSNFLGESVLNTNGDYWLGKRRELLTDFSRDRTSQLVPLFRDTLDHSIRKWESGSPRDAVIDVSEEMFQIALNNVTRYAMGQDFSTQFLEAIEVLLRDITILQNANFGFPLTRSPVALQEYRAAMDVVEREFTTCFEGGTDTSCPHLLAKNLCQRGRDVDEDAFRDWRNNIISLIIAGHETTAVTICWALYLLTTNREFSRRFYTEIDEVIGERPVEEKDLPRLKYLRRIIDETLRLYPPLWIVTRKALSDTVIGGHTIPAGAGILICPYLIHRHPEFWFDADNFNPGRFADDAPDIEPYAYLPFFAGRHLCLGKYFAITEILVTLVTLGQRFRFELAGDPTVEPEPLLSLRIRGGLKLRISTRENARS